MQKRGAHKKLGETGETLAAEFLISKNYRILGRNVWLERIGEIDILAEDGDVIVVVEVKTRTHSTIDPVYALTPAKQRKLRLLGRWCATRYPGQNIRFDAVLIEYEGGKAKIQHLEGILE